MKGTGPCTSLCIQGRKNCAAGCCACVDDSYNTGIYTGPGGPGGTPGPSVISPPPSFKQNVLNGVTFPILRVTGLENVTNGVTFPTLPSVSGVSVDSLKQNVTTPSVPAVATTESTTTSDSSLNWLWVLLVIPVGIAAVAMSKSK